MKNTILKFTSLLLAIFFSCNDTDGINKDKTGKILQNQWGFNSLSGWTDGSQNMDGLKNYAIQGDTLRIFTRPNTWDRPKVHTQTNQYTRGLYRWRIYVPEMGEGDMASIGAFIYYDDQHELDFEIGYGTAVDRKQVNAAPDELLVFMTSQHFPYKSVFKTIKANKWYNFDLDLNIINGKYEVTWLIDGIEKNKLALLYGEEIPFYIFCSVENLKFLGDHIPNEENYALFDYVSFYQ
ncbi:MAG: hypothetical protein RR346_05645 [Bacteroidales bacterium]